MSITCGSYRGLSPAAWRPIGRRPNLVSASSQREDVGETQSNTRSVLSFLCPLLNVLSVGDLKEGRPRWYEVTTSGLASITRLPFGTHATTPSTTPPLPIRIYEFEACPFCRRVREAVTDLDLEVEVFPCPKDAQMHRTAVEEIGGKLQFPFMVDENTGEQLYESDAIVQYLYATYAVQKDPPSGMLETTVLTGWMPTVLRIGRGMTRYEKSATRPLQLLELYNYENNQFSRLVREVLCELELPYRCISAGKESRNRERLKEISGKTTVPFLVDPNTGAEVGDSEKIIEYLVNNYTIP